MIHPLTSAAALLALAAVGCSKQVPPPVDGPPPTAAEPAPTPDAPGAQEAPDGPPHRGRGGRRGRRGPPPEATAACEAKAPGDACSFTLRDRSITGTCEKPPRDDAKLACRPPRGAGRPGGPPPDGSGEPPPPPSR